jgi:pimeloyl-ACP methyl ester carboxylesterase
MPQKKLKNPPDYIVPLNMNGLEGRMLRVPASGKRDREILLIYGHHAMLERWWGLVENLSEYGAVTMPDLPGFGGMDSFYRIGKKPTIDNYADYLAAFIKLRFRRKRFTIVAISYGFVIVTRMLQKYPDLVKRVDILISLAGFVHKDDFVYSVPRRKFYQYATRFFAAPPCSFLIKHVGINKPWIKLATRLVPHSKRRFVEVSPELFELTMDFEVQLWQVNDARTDWLTRSEFLDVDNCQQRIDLPIYHVISQEDHYFKNEIVKQHMLVVFRKYHQYIARSNAHTPSILADKKQAGVMLPPGLRRVLGSK